MNANLPKRPGYVVRGEFRGEAAALWVEYEGLRASDEREAEYRARGICPSCEGAGDHGFEDESGLPLICFGCGGSGSYSFESSKSVGEG